MSGWAFAVVVLAPIVLGGPAAGLVLWHRNGRPESGVLRVDDDEREVHG